MICFIGAVLGDSFGYAFGKKTGLMLFTKEDSLMFKKSHLEKARKFYETHGGKAIILARFMPIIRTFAPILAGVGEMRYGTFLMYNIIGGVVWSVGLLTLGFSLGKFVPDIDRYILPIIFLIVFISMIPNVLELIKNRARKA